MDLRDRELAAGIEGLPAGKHLTVRLKRWWVIVAVLAALLNAGGNWFANIEPIRAGGGSGVVGPGRVDIDNYFGSEVQLNFQAKGKFSLEFDVVNAGPFDIEVLGIDERPEWFSRLERMEVGSRSNLKRVPVDSFALSRGSYKVMVLHYEFADCDFAPVEGPAHHGISWNTVRIRYEMLGMTRTQEFELPWAVSVRMNGGDPAECRSQFNPLFDAVRISS